MMVEIRSQEWFEFLQKAGTLCFKNNKGVGIAQEVRVHAYHTQGPEFNP